MNGNYTMPIAYHYQDYTDKSRIFPFLYYWVGAEVSSPKCGAQSPKAQSLARTLSLAVPLVIGRDVRAMTERLGFKFRSGVLFKKNSFPLCIHANAGGRCESHVTPSPDATARPRCHQSNAPSCYHSC
uniref:Uncharacterized protein n=1 Tax=Timema cristinae TaxID=61476 RepID=A0A7R9CDC4_TIMCR|nr:unnamed protein product [Timema cristinae]